MSADIIFDRAADIAKAALDRHTGDIMAALIELCGSVDVADSLVEDWGEVLALKLAAVRIAERETTPAAKPEQPLSSPQPSLPK